MYQVFKSLIVSNIVVKNIDLYGCIVSINRRLSNDIVRKRSANCLVISRKHDKNENVNRYRFDEGDTSYWLGYLLHRDNDLPAVFDGDYQEWYKYGKLHRDNDNPAIICGNTKEWYKNGKLHRDNDKPAFIYGDEQWWYQNGELHRDNDKPAIIDGDIQKWYKNGEEYLPNL